jgi:hypothetical protein
MTQIEINSNILILINLTIQLLENNIKTTKYNDKAFKIEVVY